MATSGPDVRELELAILYSFSLVNLEPGNPQTQLRDQATAYLEQAKQAPEACQYFVTLLRTTERTEVKFYALQTFQELLSSQRLTDDARQGLRGSLLSWLKGRVNEIGNEPPFIRNKLAVVLVTLLRVDYPQRWPTAFTDLRTLLSSNEQALSMLVKILTTFDEEIVAPAGQRSRDEMAQSTLIKDTMRDTNTTRDIFELFYVILTNYSESARELCLSTLEAMKLFIDWADISYVVNDQFIPVLFNLMGKEEIRQGTCECFRAVVHKGMNDLQRIEMVKGLGLVKLLSQLNLSDEEFAVSVGHLVNEIAINLFDTLEKLDRGSIQAPPESNVQSIFGIVIEQLHECIPLVFSLLNFEDKDVSECVLPSTKALVDALKRQVASASTPSLSAGFNAMKFLERLMVVLLGQFRYPLDFTFAPNDEDEAEVEVHRREIRKIFVNISRACPKEALSFLCNQVSMLLANFAMQAAADKASYRDVEACFSFIYFFGEAHPSPSAWEKAVDTKLFTEMVSAIIKTMAQTADQGSNLPHHSVLHVYHDLVIRYVRLWKADSSLLPIVLNTMFGNLGLKSHNASLRSRVCYFLLRLCKSLGSQIVVYAEQILRGIEAHLVVPKERDNELAGFTVEDRLNLFELAGRLLGSGLNSDVQKQVLGIIVGVQSQAIEQGLSIASTRPGQIGLWISRVIAAVGHLSKGLTKIEETVANIIVGFLQKCLLAVQTLPSDENVRSKVLFFLHRMLVVIPDHLLQYLQQFLACLVRHCDVKDIADVSVLLNQTILTYKGRIHGLFEAMFLSTVQKFYEVMPNDDAGKAESSRAPDGPMTATQLERIQVQKHFYGFIHCMVSNELADVLIVGGNAQHFEAVLSSILEGCIVPDVTINRTCFGILRVLIEVWMKESANDENATVNGTGLGGGTGQPTGGEKGAQGRKQYGNKVLQELTSAAWRCLCSPHFDFEDAQAYMTLKEISQLLLLVAKTIGSDYRAYLVNVFFRTVMIDAHLGEQLLGELEANNVKGVGDQLRKLVTSKRGVGF